jgi:hypothetical protein
MEDLHHSQGKPKDDNMIIVQAGRKEQKKRERTESRKSKEAGSSQEPALFGIIA